MKERKQEKKSQQQQQQRKMKEKKGNQLISKQTHKRKKQIHKLNTLLSRMTRKKKQQEEKEHEEAQWRQNFEVGFEKDLNKEEQFHNEVSINAQQSVLQHLNHPYAPPSIQLKDDFYTFINYRWLQEIAKEKEMAPDEEKYFVQVDDFRIIQNKVYSELIENVKEYIKTTDTPHAKCIKNVYNSLYNLNEHAAKNHMYHVKDTYQSYIEQDDLWGYLAHINENEIVSWACPLPWSMQADDKHATKFANIIGFPELSLYDYLIYLDDDELLYQTNDEIEARHHLKHDFLQYVTKIFDGCYGKGKHDLVAEDVYQVEKEIMMTLSCHDNTIHNDNDLDYYNVVTKEESLSKYGFDWEQFAIKLGYKEVPSYFICYSLQFLKCMCTLLQMNWKTPKWKSYWHYLYLKQLIRYDNTLRDVYYEFNGKEIKGQPVIFPKNLYPIFGLSLTFNTFLTEQYEKKNQKPDHIRYVRELGNDLIQVYKRIIKRNKWLSKSTKKHALKKLEKLDLLIARPETLREDPLLPYVENDAWLNMLMLCLWKKQQYLELSGKSIIDIPIFDWNAFKLTGKQSYIVNAFYTPTENSIYIPLAYLQKPFIDLSEKGIEYNLAFLGQTLAHEMSHALDESGSKYDANGNLHNWWKPKDAKKYKKIIKDIINQYEEYAEYDGITFDASIGIGEDMADISGMAICVEYLRDIHVKNKSVDPVISLSFQKFFTYFAIQNRQHIYKNAIKAQLKTNPHPMDKYRTNVPLSRLQLFRKLYDIQKGDKMWWHSTSTIW